MRWVIYEFYNFKLLEKEKLLSRNDFTAIDDDMVFILHKTTVKDEVFPILLVLSRMLNYQIDKKIRTIYKLVDKYQSPFFPIEQGSESQNQYLHVENIDTYQSK